MDLNSLLNKTTPCLAFADIQRLLKANDTETTIENITSATFVYPHSIEQSYAFFDVYIQLLLTLQSTRYSLVLRDSLRTCIMGILKQHGLAWLLSFPSHVSQETWHQLHTHPDLTILIYLYGFVLALPDKQQTDLGVWSESLLHFLNSCSPVIILHMLMSFWAKDEQYPTADLVTAWLVHVNSALSHKESFWKAIHTLLGVLSKADTDYLQSSVDQQLEYSLHRSSFTSSELTLVYLRLQKHLAPYHHLSKAHTAFLHTSLSQNPLLKRAHRVQPTDLLDRTALLRKGTQRWMVVIGSVTPFEFNIYLKHAIQHHYPNERKTMLDLILAEWIVRDPFGCHRTFLLDCIVQWTPRYSPTAAPFHAIVQLFSGREETGPTEGYTIKTGAKVDVVDMDGASELMRGCCAVLEQLTRHGTKAWIEDCLTTAAPSIVTWYVGWLAMGVTLGKTEQEAWLLVALAQAHARALASHVVPACLRALDTHSLAWLVQQEASWGVLVDYFGQTSQGTSRCLTRDLLRCKPKAYMDLLVQSLRRRMSMSMSPSVSKAWFQHHFLASVLEEAGSDVSHGNVASQWLCQILTVPDEYEWYFGTPSSPSLDRPLAGCLGEHDVMSVWPTGLASLLQEMARLSALEADRLTQLWRSQWVSQHNGSGVLTAPAHWILQCLGLYDLAPACIKQLMEEFLRLGLVSYASGRPFIVRMMDLILLSDMPEAEEMLDLLVLSQTHQEDAMVGSIGAIFMQLVEQLKLESRSKHIAATHAATTTTITTTTTTAAAAAIIPPHAKRQRPKNQWHERRGRGGRRGKYFRKLKEDEKADGRMEEEKEEEVNATAATLEGETQVNLILLIQRAIGFLQTALSASDQQSVCASARRKLWSTLACSLIFYEPLAALGQLSLSEELQQDRNSIIQACLHILQKDHPSLYDHAKRVLGHC
ncbi:hypothetical protein BDF14DRAFT_1882089 [Spinellus fusiger]|nr:hypothetical protein BDF14DRAFT_1882089 [Spinellus fusiger]